MVSLSNLRENINTLINQYVYTKEETKENFDNFIENEIRYANGNLIINDDYLKTLWQPALNGETGANYKYSYSEANGEGSGKGFVLKNGFANVEEWELSFEFKHDTKYTGIIFLCNAETYTIPGSDHNTNVLKTWEGSWPGGERYASASTGTVGYFDVTVTKINSTHVRLQSIALNRDTTVEATWLSSANYLSCGAVHNDSSSGGGTSYIKNVKVVAL